MIPTTSILMSSCIGDTCGWIAALVALLAAGTYGVPIKETMYQITDLNPFVFQTYKVIIFFLVSIMTVLVFQVPMRTTFFYGTLSGFLWVCGGTGGIVAVRYAGIATAVGTWASIMICINFTWGILVFNEPVVNLYNTVAAFLLLALGLVGMSTYGDPGNSKCAAKSAIPSTTINSLPMGDHHDCSTANNDTDFSTYKKEMDTRSIPCRKSTLSSTSNTSCRHLHRNFSSSNSNNNNNNDDEYELEETSESNITSTLLKQRKVFPSCNDEESAESDSVGSTNSTAASTNSFVSTITNSNGTLLLNYNPETHVRLFCSQIIVTKRVAGIMAALFNGFMSGSSLIPMHYAKRQPNGNWSGLNYLISFSVGSLFSCICIWIVYYATLVVRQHRMNKKSSSSLLVNTFSSTSNPNIATNAAGNVSSNTDDLSATSKSYHYNLLQQALSKMPDAYFRVLWKSGLAAGLLNAIAMVGSVLAVTYLGQGVGNSVIQCKIIVRYVFTIGINPVSFLHTWHVGTSSHKKRFSFCSLESVVCGAYIIIKKLTTQLLYENGSYRHL